MFNHWRQYCHATNFGHKLSCNTGTVMQQFFELVKSLAVQGVCGCDRFVNGSIKDVFRTIVQKDGYRGLMRGWMPRMLFHAPAAAICWSTYEASKTFFQELNDSSHNENVT